MILWSLVKYKYFIKVFKYRYRYLDILKYIFEVLGKKSTNIGKYISKSIYT